MTTLIEKSILNERLEKSRSGTYLDTSENRRKHRVGQKYGSEKKEEEKPEKTDSNKMSPEQQLEAINKVIAAVNEGKLKLPPEEINTLVAKKTMAEEAVKQAKGEKKPEKKEEPKKDSWVAKYGKNSYDTRLQQAKDEVERLKNKKRSEKEKKSDEKSAKKAEEMKERIKGSEKSEADKEDLRAAREKLGYLQDNEERLIKRDGKEKYEERLKQAKNEVAKLKGEKPKEEKEELDEDGELVTITHDKEKFERYRIFRDLHAARMKRGTSPNLSKMGYLKNSGDVNQKGNEKYYELQKEFGDKKYAFKEKIQEGKPKEETEESYTRVKFEDVPNSGKVNLKKYLSERVRKGVDEKWSNIKNIPTDNLKKMEKGLVNDLNKNFEAIKKSQRAELLYSIMKVKGELANRGKESQKTENKNDKPKQETQPKKETPKKEEKKETSSEVKNISSGAVWSSGDEKEGMMRLTVNKDGSVYGINDKWDFEAKDKQEAYEKLKKWGYEYVGVD